MDPTLVPFIQRLERDPEDREAIDALWKWFTDRKQYEPLAVIAEKVAARRRDPTSASALYHRAGKLWEDDVRRIDKATAAYGRAIELAPKNDKALAALAALHFRKQRFDLAAPLYERLVLAAPDARQRAAALDDLLELRERMADDAGKIVALRELILLRPADDSLKRQMVPLLTARIASPDGTDKDRIEAARLIGQLAGNAISVQRLEMAEEALGIWPGDEGAFELIEAEYGSRGRAAHLVPRRIDFVTSNPDSRLAPRVRKDLANHYLRTKQIDAAIEALTPLRASDPDARRMLTDIYRDAGRHAELADMLGDTPQTKASAQDVDALRKRADLYRQAGDRAAMMPLLLEIVRLEPTDTVAFAEIERDYRTRTSFSELRDLLALAAEEPKIPHDVRVTRLREAAILSEQHLGDPNGAVAAWTALRAIAKGHAEADIALERLLARTGRRDELLAFLQDRARGATNPVEARELWLRFIALHREHKNDAAAEATLLAGIWAQHPDDGPIALALVDARRRCNDIAGVEAVLRALVATANPDNVAMRWSQLASHLERVGRTEDARAAWEKVRTLDPSQAMAWDAEERLLETAGKHEALLALLTAHASHPIASGGLAGLLYVRAARLAHRLRDTAVAIAHAERAHRLMGAEPALVALLTELYQASGNDEALDALRVRQKSLIPPPPERSGPPMLSVPPAHIAPPDRVSRISLADASETANVEPEPESEESDVPTLRPPPPVEPRAADALAAPEALRALAPPPVLRIAPPGAPAEGISAAPPSIPRIEPIVPGRIEAPIATSPAQPPPISPRKSPSLPGLIRSNTAAPSDGAAEQEPAAEIPSLEATEEPD